jgi:type IV pilus assembly protein PilC
VAEKAEKMTFQWEGTDKQGQRVKGEINSTSESLAKIEVRKLGVTPMRVRKKPKPLLGGGKKKITPKDIAVFSRQLATMIASGIPLVQAFEIVGQGHENPSMQELLLGVKSDIEGGDTLADALRRRPQHFDELYCNLVEAGEQAGALETLLDKIATYKEKTEEIKGKIKGALFYPVAVIIVGLIVSAILLVFVVPQFAELFQDFGADLPAFTQFVLGLSEFMQAYWWVIFGGGGLAVYLFSFAKKRSSAFNRFLDRLMLRIPVFGPLVEKSAVARFARTMATMFAAGVPLVEALDSVSGATGNSVYGDAVQKMKQDASTGQQINASMRQTQLFPSMVVQMVAIGEESGALDTMLTKVADFFEREVDDAVNSLSSLMEPMIMAILGVLVGGLVIAMYLPIFKLGSVV